MQKMFNFRNKRKLAKEKEIFYKILISIFQWQWHLPFKDTRSLICSPCHLMPASATLLWPLTNGKQTWFVMRFQHCACGGWMLLINGCLLTQDCYSFFVVCHLRQTELPSAASLVAGDGYILTDPCRRMSLVNYFCVTQTCRSLKAHADYSACA